MKIETFTKHYRFIHFFLDRIILLYTNAQLGIELTHYLQLKTSQILFLFLNLCKL